jgi:Uncharacterized protein conserved in bacteria
MSKGQLIEKCREYRHSPTKAEALLWEELRDRRLNGYKFRRQHPIAGFIVDFYCPEVKLAIEVDGSVHREPGQADYDRERSRILAETGVEVLRFWNEEVINGRPAVIERITAKITQLKKEFIHQ